jgi:hypothetical protein
MATSLRGREPGSRGTFTVGRRYQATQWRPWLRRVFFVWQWFLKCSHDLCVKMSNKSDYRSKPRLYLHSITWQYLTISRWMVRWFIIDKFGSNWKEVVLAYSWHYPDIFPDGQRKRKKNLSQDRWCPSQHSNRAPPQGNFTVLPLD